MRLFIAINFMPEIKQKLTTLSDELRETSSRGRFTIPENLHLTLVFLGECDARQESSASAAMDAVAFEQFDIEIDRIGRFKRDGGDLWWVGICENKALQELHKNLTAELVKNGFKLEKRKFSPHITLGRDIVTSTEPRQIEPFGETVDKIDLMKSEHINGKLTYTAIYSKRIREEKL